MPIGGSQWHTRLATNRIMLSLQSPTANVTNADLQDNELFNTGLSTQLSPPVAMAIHAIRWNIFQRTHISYEDLAEAIIAVLTEDTGATVASNELTDPRTLAEAGMGFVSVLETAAGGSDADRPLLWTAEFDPPIITIAQRLNLVAEIVEDGATTSPSFDVHAKLYYTVEPIDQTMLTMLTMRLNLAVQP